MHVAVIGGGVIGLTCAHDLVRRGAEVTVLDMGEFGEAASWGNAGWITPSFSSPLPAPGLVRASLSMMMRCGSPIYIRPTLDPNFLRWMLWFTRYCNAAAYRSGMAALAALNRRSYELFDTLGAEIEFEMHRDGILFAFSTAEGMHHVLEDLDAMTAHGYPVPQILTPAQARELEPALTGRLEGAVLAPDERHVLPFSLTGALVSSLAGHATLRPWTAVTGIDTGGGRVTRIVTAAGPLHADVVLIAAGAWSGHFARQAGFRLPMQAGKGYSIHITSPDLEIRRPLYLAEAKIAASPFIDSLRIAGTMELSGINTKLDRRRIESIRCGVTSFLSPAWEKGGAVREWVGMRPMLPDGLPAIGKAPNLSNLFIAGGHGMLGVTLAPVTADAIGGLICEGVTETDLQPFAPGRFGRA